MESYFACRVCLVTDVPFTSLNDDPVLGDAYLNIVGEVDYNPLRTVCYECSTLLQKCSELRQKCMRTNTILMDILKEHHLVTYSSIKEVDRTKYQLKSNLSMFFAPGFDIPSEVINKNDSTTVNVAVKQEFPAEPSFAFDYPNATLNSPPAVELKVGEIVKMEPLEDMDDFQDETECSDKSASSLEDMVLDKETNKRKKIQMQNKQIKYKWKKGKRDNDENENSNEKQEFPAEPSFAFDYPNATLNSPPAVEFKVGEIVKMEPLEDMDDFQDETECSDKNASSLEDMVLHKKTNKRKKIQMQNKQIKYKWKKEKRDNDENENSNEVYERSNDEEHDEEINNYETESNDELVTNAKRKKGCSKNNTPKLNLDLKYFRDYADITYLTPEMAKQEVLSRKETNNYLNSNFKCELCFRGFEIKNTYDNHMKKHNSEFGQLECEFCHFWFTTDRALRHHIYTCHKRKFFCKICPYQCYSSTQARSHVELHKGKKYICSCGETFDMANSLSTHKKFKHGAECVCDMCGSTYTSSAGLRTHILYIHRQEQNEKSGPFCSECNVHFANDTAWKRHLVLSSKHTVSNGCEYCGETFGDENELKNHLRTHFRKNTPNVKLPSGCVLCHHWLTTRTEYKEHMLLAHPESKSSRTFQNRKPVQSYCVCEYCGKSFKQKSHLVYHLNKHSGERPYECNICGKPFEHPSALSIHKLTHSARPSSPQPMHKCHVCPRQYKTKNGLGKHLKAHMGIRPYQCKLCDKSFLNLCEVRLHTRHVHDKVPWPKKDRSKSKKNNNQDDN